MEGERWRGKEKERKTETERETERMTQGVEEIWLFWMVNILKTTPNDSL